MNMVDALDRARKFFPDREAVIEDSRLDKAVGALLAASAKVGRHSSVGIGLNSN